MRFDSTPQPTAEWGAERKNRRIVGVGRNPYRSSSPSPCNEQGCLQLSCCSAPGAAWPWDLIFQRAGACCVGAVG